MTIFTANICNNAETKTVQVNGVPTLVTNFNVAENYVDASGERKTQYYRIALWREKGAKLAQYLTKGRSVTLTGRVRGRAYLDKEGKPACALEMSNPQITFNNGSHKDEVGEAIEAAVESEIPATEEPF